MRFRHAIENARTYRNRAVGTLPILICLSVQQPTVSHNDMELGCGGAENAAWFWCAPLKFTHSPKDVEWMSIFLLYIFFIYVIIFGPSALVIQEISEPRSSARASVLAFPHDITYCVNYWSCTCYPVSQAVPRDWFKLLRGSTPSRAEFEHKPNFILLHFLFRHSRKTRELIQFMLIAVCSNGLLNFALQHRWTLQGILPQKITAGRILTVPSTMAVNHCFIYRSGQNVLYEISVERKKFEMFNIHVE